MFEVLNNRGKLLSELEKLKNYILYISSKLGDQSLRETTNAVWSKIFKTLMRRGLDSQEDENRFLLAHWQAYAGTKSYNTRLYDDFKDRYPVNYKAEFSKYSAILHQYLKDLEESLLIFVDFYSPDHQDAFSKFLPQERIELRRWVKRINKIKKLTSIVSLLIAVNIKGKGYDDLISTMVESERLGFLVYHIAEKRGDTAKSVFIKSAYQLYNDQIQLEEVLKNLHDVAATHCSSSHFFSFLKSLEVDFYKWDGIPYFLAQYEYSKRLDEIKNAKLKTENNNNNNNDSAMELKSEIEDPMTIDIKFCDPEVEECIKGAEIEHILPQDYDAKGWKKKFDCPEDYVNCLGNLTLTHQNSELKNKSFLKKCKLYSKSTIAIEKEIVEFKSWDATSVNTRTESMCEWAAKRWDVKQTKKRRKSMN